METRLFDPADPPEWLDPEWWRDRPHCNHLEAPTGAHRSRLEKAAEFAAYCARLTPDRTVVDLGAGDGALLSLLPPSIREKSYGYDLINNDLIYAARARGVQVRPGNVSDWLIDGSGHIELAGTAVLTEVLEHMADPHGFLAALNREPVRYVVASSPFQETADKHEWNHAWAWDTLGYESMFRTAGFEAARMEIVDWSQVWTFLRVGAFE